MFHHVKDLQYNVRVSQPDPRFAGLLLEQFGGANGELSAAMQYFAQAFAARRPYPDKYDMLMDIAAEELGHLEMVGATVTMLLDGINGELKASAEESELMQLLGGNGAREELMHAVAFNPEILVNTGGGPALTNSHGAPWSAGYISANGDLTVDLRSDIAAEARAKIVYEYLMQYTDDPHVRDTLQFLMTREIAHFQMFAAALETIEPNFPPGVLQGDARFSHTYFNLSDGVEDARGPWNEGQGPWPKGQSWDYIDNPLEQVERMRGQADGSSRDVQAMQKKNDEREREISRQRSEEVRSVTPSGSRGWSTPRR